MLLALPFAIIRRVCWDRGNRSMSLRGRVSALFCGCDCTLVRHSQSFAASAGTEGTGPCPLLGALPEELYFLLAQLSELFPRLLPPARKRAYRVPSIARIVFFCFCCVCFCLFVFCCVCFSFFVFCCVCFCFFVLCGVCFCFFVFCCVCFCFFVFFCFATPDRPPLAAFVPQNLPKKFCHPPRLARRFG